LTGEPRIGEGLIPSGKEGKPRFKKARGPRSKDGGYSSAIKKDGLERCGVGISCEEQNQGRKMPEGGGESWFSEGFGRGVFAKKTPRNQKKKEGGRRARPNFMDVRGQHSATVGEIP